jgi:hypothetical protein
VRFGIPSLAATGQTVAAVIILGASTISPVEAIGENSHAGDTVVAKAIPGTDFDGFASDASPAPERIPARIYDPLMRLTAAYDVDQFLVAAIVWKESKWDVKSVGDSGRSVGLMQLHENGIGAGLSADERMDPATNLDIGIRGFRSYLDRFGSVEAALAAFNVGPNALADANGDWRAIASEYVTAVLTRESYYRESGLVRDASDQPVILLPPIISHAISDVSSVPALSPDWRPVVQQLSEATRAQPTGSPFAVDSTPPSSAAVDGYNANRNVMDNFTLPTR